MTRACSWDTAPEEIPSGVWEQLSTLYEAPSDIDLFTGSLAETRLDGAHMGPTFACIVGQQVRI